MLIHLSNIFQPSTFQPKPSPLHPVSRRGTAPAAACVAPRPGGHRGAVGGCGPSRRPEDRRTRWVQWTKAKGPCQMNGLFHPYNLSDLYIGSLKRHTPFPINKKGHSGSRYTWSIPSLELQSYLLSQEGPVIPNLRRHDWSPIPYVFHMYTLNLSDLHLGSPITQKIVFSCLFL